MVRRTTVRALNEYNQGMEIHFDGDVRRQKWCMRLGQALTVEEFAESVRHAQNAANIRRNARDEREFQRFYEFLDPGQKKPPKIVSIEIVLKVQLGQ